MFRHAICGGFLSAAVFLSPSLAHADKPQRIVSLSVCADQYVMELVDRGRIAAVSEDAQDPRISLHHKKADGLPTTRGNAEEVLLLKPDLVIANRWRGAKTVEILKQSGIPVLLLSLPVTLEEIEAETRKIAKALGEEEKGESLLQDLQTAMSAKAKPNGPRAAYFMPGGYSAGQNTFVEMVLHSAGYSNIASEMGLRGWSSLALEELVLQQPDVLIMSFFKKGKFSLSTRLRQHSALQEMMKTIPVIDVPDKYWACGGWFLFEAINYLKGKKV